MDYFLVAFGVCLIGTTGAMWWFIEDHKRAMERHSEAMKQSAENNAALMAQLEYLHYNMKQQS